MVRSISDQSEVELGGRSSVLARQRRDHIKLNGLLRNLALARADQQSLILLRIYRLVFPHAFAEEAVLWPVMRRVLPEGHSLTLQVEVEHQQINELVTRIEALSPTSPEHQQVLNRVLDLLQKDVRDEEDELLPRLQAKLTVGQLRLLGLAWEGVRLVAPTRAHPIVSRRPPGNVLSALPLALLDRLRDLVDMRFPPHSPGTLAKLFCQGSSALARASHAAERLPGMKSGEDHATRVARDRGAGGGGIAFATIAAASAGLILVASRQR